ncbi:hypothetical protein [Nocardioides sp. LHG3406-4]|uniref:hypothetical protein n=1 Tax=Nocardioides sp. LHG3406-4 TaxID=2804575 RepID=UPI003CFADCA4
MSALPPWDPDEYDRAIKARRKGDARSRSTHQPSPIPLGDRKKILGYPLRHEFNPTQVLGRKPKKEDD